MSIQKFFDEFMTVNSELPTLVQGYNRIAMSSCLGEIRIIPYG